MNYSLCISPTCPNCASILKSLNEMEVSIKIKNIEKQTNKSCVSPIVPALYKGRKLIAYGKDIIKHFNAQTNERSPKNQTLNITS